MPRSLRSAPKKKKLPRTPLPQRSSQGKSFIWIVFLLLTVLVILFVYTVKTGALSLQRFNTKFAKNTRQSFSPSPTPIILKAGKEIYSVSQGKHAGPAVSQVTFDPLDVKKGETLTVSATASDTAMVTSVTGNLKTDGGSQSFTLSKTKDDGAKSIWVGTVTLESTVWYSYILTITASSTNGTNSVTVAPRS